jgi:hypothetical protein
MEALNDPSKKCVLSRLTCHFVLIFGFLFQQYKLSRAICQLTVLEFSTFRGKETSLVNP